MRPRRQLISSLRSRIVVAFVLGTAAVSIATSSLAYFTTRHFLITERQATVLRQAFADAALVRGTLTKDPTALADEVSAFDELSGNHVVVATPAGTYASNRDSSLADLPAGLRRAVASGDTATQTFLDGSTPTLAVGVAIPSVSSQVYATFSVADIARTLRALLLVLTGVSVLAVLGAALVGRRAAQRAVRPLHDVGETASRIAAGELSARLPDAHDRDLDALTSSFNAMAAELEERIARDAAFNSNVAHELRSPLTTLSATVEILESRTNRLDDEAREAMLLLRGDLDRFRQLIVDLLELAADDARSGLRLEEVNAAELVNRIARVAAPVIQMAKVAVLVEPELATTTLMADKRRVERIFANLIGNAQTHSNGLLAIEARRAGDHVEVAFVDAGPAIPDAERERIFERFYRGGAAGRRGAARGSGLGLAIVSEHAAVQGGSIRLERDDEGGNRFVLSLPIDEEAP